MAAAATAATTTAVAAAATTPARPRKGDEPDSTTSVERIDFGAGQDVLLKQKDGRYYLGTVVEVDGAREHCLIKFGDNTERWSSYRDLTKLSTPDQDVFCVVCKRSAPKGGHEIVVCDKCGRGYHQKCHQPEIPSICQKEDARWVCKRCVANECYRLRKNDIKYTRKEAMRSSTSNCESPTITSTKVLPYDLNSLTWDTYHRVNLEHIYCYCGGPGEWYNQMLQCGRCKQWFHEKCLGCLQYPLYCGDRFYVFVCSICNYGKEFLRRLEMKWVDLVHLMLYNLTSFNSKKYYDLDKIIIPYINDNWHALQLPPKIMTVSKTERRENILSVLTNNRNRFKCGREIKKRTTIWGLRVRLPPPSPTITLTPTGPISEHELREMWQGNRRLQFLPEMKPDTLHALAQTDRMKEIMMGIAYQQNNTPSETDSPCPSPEAEADDFDEPPPTSIIAATTTAVTGTTPSPPTLKLYKNEYAGCAKKSVPFDNVASLHRRKRLLSMNMRERASRRPKRRNTNDGVCEMTKSAGDALPLTPPESVSAPPTPPASSVSDFGNDFTRKTSGDGPESNTPCDTSGDETSSKSTLDLIIPPPKDFEGKNNPFLALLRVGDDVQKKSKKRRKDSITLPLPLTAVIPGKPLMRPTKRQLSEKDIFIGPNGEVKRRRLRRSKLAIATPAAASKTATVVPVRVDAKEWAGERASTSQINNCVDYALNGRRLRQRPDKMSEKEKTPQPTTPVQTSTPKPSPVKQEPDISMDDLKSSVNIYFGAANRIAAGERFTVKAKRVGPTGKLEFLIEWDGPGNGMT